MKFTKKMKQFISAVCTFAIVLGVCAVQPSTKVKAAGSFTPVVAEGTNWSSGITTQTVTLPAAADAYDVTALNISCSGVLYVTSLATSLAATAYVDLYSDAACTYSLGYGMTLFTSSLNTTDTATFTIPTAGTYYLKVYHKDMYSAKAPNSTVNYQTVMFSGEDKTLKADEAAITYSNDSNRTVYHKIVLKKNSVVAIAGKSMSLTSTSVYGLTVDLYDSKKNVLNSSIYLYDSNDYTNYMVLKKGTYYLGCKESDVYQIAYSAKNTKSSKAGATAKKAGKLKKGKNSFNIMPVGTSDKKAQWYKITLPKSAKLKIVTGGIGNNGSSYKIEVVPASSRVTLLNSSAYIYVNGDAKKYVTKDKMPKGVYYIKVTKSSTDQGLYYYLKVNY